MQASVVVDGEFSSNPEVLLLHPLLLLYPLAQTFRAIAVKASAFMRNYHVIMASELYVNNTDDSYTYLI